MTKAYAKRVKQTSSDKGVEKARKYLKSNGLVALPYDKGVGFCAMRKDNYENKLSDTLDSKQFSKSKRTSDAIVLKIEGDIKKELLAMRKKDEIKDNLYTRMRSTGGGGGGGGGSPTGFMGWRKYIKLIPHQDRSSPCLVALITT